MFRILVPALLVSASISACVTTTPDIPAAGWSDHCGPWDEWEAPSPTFAITEHITYVGTCGITSLLVETSDGFALLDAGTEGGAELGLAGIRRLGVDPTDIRIILTSHEHHDHVGGLAKLQAATGATVIAGGAAASVLRTGEAHPDDPQFGLHDPMTPVSNIREIDDGENAVLGDTAFHMVATPGHTPGAVSWSWRDPSGRDVVYADSLSPISRDDYRFSDHPDYVAAYREGLDRLAALPCDLLLTPHPSSSGMIERAADGFPADPSACADYAAAIRQRLDARLAGE